MKRNRTAWKRAALLPLLTALAVEGLWAWPWSRDMIVQPFIRPLLAMLRPAPGTVAMGAEPAMSVQATGAALRNPLGATPENLTAGNKLYATYCSPCHGASGQGDGPVAGGALAPANLTDPLIQQKSDGHIYGVIRNGIRAMPQYQESLSPSERWQVVLFVRTLTAPSASSAQSSAPSPSAAAPARKSTR